MTAILTPIKRKARDIKPGDLVGVDPYMEAPAQVQEVSNGGSTLLIEFKTGGPLSLDREAVLSVYVREEVEKEYLSVTDTARVIRDILKDRFPDTRFYVRSDSYSGGASIRIKWVDGPGTEKVDRIVGALEGKSFDGMIGMACYRSTWILPDGTVKLAETEGTQGSSGFIPSRENPKPDPEAKLISSGADYIFTDRKYTRQLLEAGIKRVKNEWGYKWAPTIIKNGSLGGGSNKVDTFTLSFDYDHENELRGYWEEVDPGR